MSKGSGHATHARPTNRGAAWVRLLLVWCMLLGSGGIVQVAAQPGQRETADDVAYADVLPTLRDSVVTTTDQRMNHYTMTIELLPDDDALNGNLEVSFVNTTGTALPEVYFRLYPNADHYSEGALDVTNVTVAGMPTATETSVQDTVLRVPLGGAFPNGLPPNERIVIAMDLAVRIPTNSKGSYGIFSYATGSKTWILADWHPVVAAYEADEGWQLDPPLGTVDPTFAESALYDVTLTVPADWVVVSSGRVLPDDSFANGARRTTRYIAGPIREFAMVIANGYTAQEQIVGETVVRLWSNPNQSESLTEALTVATASLAHYNDRFGTYPFTELDLVDTPLTPGTLGVSWGGLVFLDGSTLAAEQGNIGNYDFLIAHEIAHQWIGGVIGINSNDHTFIAEGLTNYIMTMFVESERGPDAAAAMLESNVAARYLALLRTSGDQIADIPWADGGPQFADVIYGKAALGFLAIRLEIGADAFSAAIRALATPGDGFAFKIATPQDFLAAFEAASGAELDPLWNSWFLSATTTADDVVTLLEQYRDTVGEPVAA